jgi:hypothetical protein
MDTLTFIFDFGISGHLARMKDGVSDPRDFYNGNLDYVAMQFPLFKKSRCQYRLASLFQDGI